MISKFQFETSRDIVFEDYLGKKICTFKDILSLKEKTTTKFGQRPKNKKPGAWDQKREWEYLESSSLNIAGQTNPIYMRDLESSINVYREYLFKLDKSDTDDFILYKKIEKTIRKIQQRIEKYGPNHTLDGQHRTDFVWDTLSITSTRTLPIKSKNEKIWYQNEKGVTKCDTFLGADNKPLKFSNLHQETQDFIHNMKCRIIIVKNLTEENAKKFFETVNQNYQMTPFLLEWTISLNETKEWIEDLLNDNPVLFDKSNQQGLLDRLSNKDGVPNSSYETEYCGEYRLVAEMIGLYHFHRKEYNKFDYNFNKVIDVLRPDFETSKEILNSVKQNLIAIADMTFKHPDYHNLGRTQLYDVMSTLFAIQSKSHPVRYQEGLWNTDLEIADVESKKSIVKSILELIDKLKDEDKYQHIYGKFQTVKVQITARNQPKKREFWMYYLDKEGKRQKSTFKEELIPNTDMYNKVISNEYCYSAHTKDQNNIHERDKMILTRLEKEINLFKEYDWLVPPRQSANRNKAAKAEVRNTGILDGENVYSIKGANISDGHKDPRSKSHDESLENLKPQGLRKNQNQGARNLE